MKGLIVMMTPDWEMKLGVAEAMVWLLRPEVAEAIVWLLRPEVEHDGGQRLKAGSSESSEDLSWTNELKKSSTIYMIC